MEKTFRVTITAKRGTDISGSLIQAAVSTTDPTNESYRNVEVEEVVEEAKVAYAVPLYALAQKSANGGRKSAGVWKVIEFYSSKRRADNAFDKAMANCRACSLPIVIAVLESCPANGIWHVARVARA